MSAALKPCPFCGSKQLSKRPFGVKCQTCEAWGPCVDRTETWNTRAEQRPQVTDEMVNRAASCMYEAFHGKSLKGYLIDARLILEAALEAEK